MASSEEGFKKMMVAAKAMAMTMVDLLADPTVLESAREEFRQSRNKS